MSPIYQRPAARAWRTVAAPDTMAFHSGLPGYAPTPLREVPELARELGVGRVFVKEESARLGLPAFKVLGASYAISRVLSQLLGSARVCSLEELRDRREELGELELIAATDGNHGRAVARVAAMLGLAARIFTPADITPEAKAGIESEGAVRIELAAPYDDVVAAAAQAASTTALLIQDTSWSGYEQVPGWIVDGYDTLLREVDDQLATAGAPIPDLVTVPVGVGSLAQAVLRHYRSRPGQTSVLSVEPETAPALFTSLQAGRPTSVETSPTVMAGLNCGTPSELGWQTFQAGLDAAVLVTDPQAAQAVGDLAALGVDAGPCGAATLAGVRTLLRTAPLPAEAIVVLLSTEGRRANPLPAEAS